MAGTLVLATHGVRGGPGSAAAHARFLQARGGWAQVLVGCLKASPSLEEAMADAPRPVTVVPLLMSEGVIYDRLRRSLHRIAPEGGWRLTAPVGASPGLTGVVRDRAVTCCGRLGWKPEATALLVIGHGTARSPASATHAAAMAAALEGRGFAAAAHALLEEAPLPVAAIAGLAIGQVVAVGLFLDHGPHGDDDVREALARSSKAVAYAGPVGADPALARLILGQVDAQ
ncbi:MAG: CbiX/SirB N-terminal domain-containing protein [Reyranellaceae bacterium]